MAPSSDSAARSTVVALVGCDSNELLEGISDLPAVAALSLRGQDPSDAALAIATRPQPYVVHDADPLEHVAAAWVELFQERATLGTLEVEVEALLALFDAGTAFMPDYYVVASPGSVEGEWKHWWLGALAHRAPARVLPIEGSAAALRRRLRSLPASRPWPDPASWLPAVHFDIPDRVGLYGSRGAA